MLEYINILDLIEIKPTNTEQGKDTYQITEVLPFFLENNDLYYFLDNSGKRGKIKCIKNYDNIYKIFSYRTSGQLSHSIYIILDVKNQTIIHYNGGFFAGKEEVKEWVEYLLTGGTYEKAIANNKSIREQNNFNPFDGI